MPEPYSPRSHITLLTFLPFPVSRRSREGTTASSPSESFPLISIKQSSRSIPILPVLPTSPPSTLALLRPHQPPTTPTARDRDRTRSELEYYAQLQRLEGPWNLSLILPFDKTVLHHSHAHRATTRPSFIEIEHKVVIDVVVSQGVVGDEGVEGSGSGKGKKAVGALSSSGTLENIKIGIPIHLLSVRCLCSYVYE